MMDGDGLSVFGLSVHSVTYLGLSLCMYVRMYYVFI